MMKKMLKQLLHKFRVSTASSRPLPDFIIIGAQKAGTTSLFKYLSRHPVLQPSITTKELHYFDSNYTKGELWYRSNFPLRRAGKLYYEASPSYLLHPCVPERMAEMVPKAKLIILLRNPVERAYSSYQHQVRAGRETLSFEDAVACEAQRIGGDMQKILDDPSFAGKTFRRFSYVERGKYIAQIRRWHKFFPRENVLVLESETFWSGPQESLAKIYSFLGVEPMRLALKKKYNTGNYKSEMLPEIRQKLEELYRPYNDELFEYLDERFDWS